MRVLIAAAVVAMTLPVAPVAKAEGGAPYLCTYGPPTIGFITLRRCPKT